MSPHDQERIREMLVAIAPIMLGLAALLLTVISVWRFHELRLQRMRASAAKGSEPKFLDGIVLFGWPILVVTLPFRGLRSRLDQVPDWIVIGMIVGSFLLYPLMIFAYVMVAHRISLPLEGAEIKILPGGFLAASLAISLFAARTLGWH